MNETLEGGKMAADMRIEPWLDSLFQRDPLKPGSVIEHPENLVDPPDLSDNEKSMLRTMYSFEHIRQAFFLRRMCVVQSGGTSIVHALCDNFLMDAFAKYNLAPLAREEWKREHQRDMYENTRATEAIGALPFCSIEDPSQNELFMFLQQRDVIQNLERQRSELMLTVEQDQQLMRQAAEDKVMLTNALNSAREAADTSIRSIRETEGIRFEQLQMSTETLIAERTAELNEKLQFVMREADKTLAAMHAELTAMRAALDKKEREIQTREMEIKTMAVLTMKEEMHKKEEEFKVLYEGKLNAAHQEMHAEKILLEAKLKGAKEEVSAANASMKDLRTQFGMLSTQNAALGQSLKNAEEGMTLRDREISTLRASLEDERTKHTSSVISLETQLGNLRQQLASTVQNAETQLASTKSRLNAECEQDLAQLSRDANVRHEQALEAMRAGKAAEIASITQQYASQIQAIRQEFQRVQGHASKEDNCVIM